MFTGIIEGTGVVRERKPLEHGVQLQISADFNMHSTNVGESIAVNGCCLTITSRLGNSFWADVSAETVEKTTLAEIQPGDPVNLERPLQKGGRVGGHIVQGHVDGMGTIVTIKKEGVGQEIWIQIPTVLVRYIVEKGSVALDGVSLTVNVVEKDRFSVMIIPHTQTVTTFQNVREGQRLNLEVDILGKYLEKIEFLDIEQYRDRGELAREFLKKHGF